MAAGFDTNQAFHGWAPTPEPFSRPASVASHISSVTHVTMPDDESGPGYQIPISDISLADAQKDLHNSSLARDKSTRASLVEIEKRVHDAGMYAQAAYNDTQSLIGAVGKIEAQLKTGVSTPTLAPTSQPPKVPKPKTSGKGTTSVKTTKPDMFDGTKKDQATDFRVACTQHLRSTYPDTSEEQQVMFVTSYLEGVAHDWLHPHLELDLTNPVPWLHDIGTFWVEFDKRFGEVNKKESYCSKLRKLTHTKSVQDYLQDFQTYSCPLQYDDTVLRDLFYDGLKDEIKSAMVAQLFDYDSSTTTFAQVAN
ncbi:hypothetical protein FS749_000593 [Ceratobasidium sp. UAMH 11750]|nr:hypothetical protein FS749_000593 [Ceratobasidium sp. UAMH 11750]